jgi:hypothetical protein
VILREVFYLDSKGPAAMTIARNSVDSDDEVGIPRRGSDSSIDGRLRTAFVWDSSALHLECRARGRYGA